jgi:tropomyosin 1
MDAIKKKMQAMKLDKDNAMERALQSEQQARDANLRAEKVNFRIYWISEHILKFDFQTQAEEEARSLQKKIQSIENELDQTQEGLMQVNAKLEEKNKALQNVSTFLHFFIDLGLFIKAIKSASLWMI